MGSACHARLLRPANWLVACLLVTTTIALAQPPSSWISARDLGASGSAFTTTAVATAGSKQITVADVGDFQAGQGVMVSRCNARYVSQTLWGPNQNYGAGRALKDEVEIRGYDGAAGSWIVYVLDVIPGKPSTFRWTDDLGRTWQPAVPITGDWQALSGGTEVRFGLDKLDWEAGYAVTFSARDQLVSRIEKIEGNVLSLRDAANRDATDAEVRHCDDEALQAAIAQALKERRNLYVPPGHYRLARGLNVRQASGITIEAAAPEHTLLDLSEGTGACFTLSDGAEVTLRNFRMVGHTGFADADIAGYLNLKGARGVWGFYLKPSNAVSISGTERVLVENCHGSRMSCECFVSGGPSRATPPPRRHSKSVTYLRCSATDCGRNGFNDWNCGPENTSVLYCRIVDVGGCTWEGAGRFVRFIGNYVRNSGTVAMGNLGTANRDPSFDQVCAGQHIIADNVFEGGMSYGGRFGGFMMRTAHGSTQVIIRSNLFVNFNSSGVDVSGACDATHFASGNTIVTGNIFDMTCVTGQPVTRCAVDVSANDTIVSGNQIYVRGAADPAFTGIRLREPALNVSVHDNLIRGCGAGLVSQRVAGRVGEVVDQNTFAQQGFGVPAVYPPGHLYRGWNLAWITGGKGVASSVVEAYDPVLHRFRLTQPREMKVGDQFEVHPPWGPNWSIHHNTISGCLKPVTLDSYGGEAASLCGNTITRGEATGVTDALQVTGRFQVLGNRIAGFDEPGAVALRLNPDRLGQAPRSIYHDNSFERCAIVVGETAPGLWEAADRRGNTCIDCTEVPK